MPKLKLGAIPDDKPVKLTVELPAQVHCDLIAYAELLAGDIGQVVEPTKLVAPMLARFMSGDRGFARLRKQKGSTALEHPTPRSPPTELQ